MYKVGIIGDKDSVMGFLALGIDIFPAYEADEIKKIKRFGGKGICHYIHYRKSKPFGARIYCTI